MSRPELLFTGPGTTTAVVLAHGAGAPMDSPFMNAIADGLAARGLRTARFEFPYMSSRRTGGRRPPDRESILRETWKNAVQALGEPSKLVIGGKSMGGRIASLMADELGVAGLVCLGYPFHPVGQPEKLRIAHLEKLATPTLIVQGERDTFGNRAEVAGFQLAKSIRIEFLGDGDHSFEPRKSSGRSKDQAWSEAVDLVAGFVADLRLI